MYKCNRSWLSCSWTSLGLLLLLIGLSACQQDDMFDELRHQEIAPRLSGEPELLSVRSSGKGRSIELDFEVSFDDEEEGLRSKTYADQEDSGAYGKVQIGGEERAHCILRRKGDPQATTYIDITWKGRGDRRIKFDNLKVKLPQGVELSDGDEWYFLAIMGGDTFDMQTGRVSISAGGNRSEAGIPLVDDASLQKIPYLLNWVRLDVSGRHELSTPETAQFRPLGALLRLQFLSNMVEAYKAISLSFTSNAIDLAGTFDPMGVTDDELASPPSRPTWLAAKNETQAQVYLLHSSEAPQARKLELPGGSAWSKERTVYIWGMPREQRDAVSSPLNTQVELQVVPLKVQQEAVRPLSRVTYAQQGHRAFRHGATYRLSNILTSDLIISEVFYDYAQPDPFASTKDNPNYSIVEVYNPTLSSVDLNHYALARLRYDEASREYRYHKLDVASLATAPDNATLLQLSLIAGHGHNKTFGDRVGRRDGNNWRRHIYTKGTPQQVLEPGQTILIAAGGYMLRDAMPDRNIYMFDEARRGGKVQEKDFAHPRGSSGYRELQTRLRDIERDYLPHAGGQPDSAVRLGLCHAMAALENGSYPNASPLDPRGGTMQLGLGQGVALIKFVGSLSTEEPLASASSYVLSDVSVPVRTDAAAYRAELLRELQGQGLLLTELDERAVGHYSYSRPRYDDFPHANFDDKMAAWTVSVSENQGGKSLGTRNYIAGLSPYQVNYSGYTADNNPEGRPFWSQLPSAAASPSLPKREWIAPPSSGANVFSLIDPNLAVIAYGEAPAQPGEEIAKAFDGDANTIYHTPHNRSARLPLPLVFHFDKPERIDYMVYMPRRDTGQNGRFLEIDIEYSPDGANFLSLTSATFVNDARPQQVDFEVGVVARSVRLIVKKGVGGFASAAEIEFRRHAVGGGFNWRSLFTDESCGELRPGVRAEDIKACPDPLYRDIARRLLAGTYDEFRVREYKPYLNPWVIANATKTWPYSVRDNPTGISVQAGDELLVRVAEGYNRLRIVVQNLDHPNNDGFGGREYSLQKGENRISIKQKGLVYVLYMAESIAELEAARPIRIHFITGRVNGYYDSQDPKHRGRWQELLGKAIDPYFDVLGEHTHLTYPTWRFRTQTADGHALIEAYDEVVKAEKELLGMYRYEDPSRGVYRLPRNRMYLNVMYHQYMYATHHHTGYNDNANALSLTAEGLRNGVWGVAHEIGHINQTRPGLAWQGMDEVTVNIKSIYVQTSVFGRPSRWEVERDGMGRNRWYKSWNTILRNKEYHGLREDGSPKLTPFWQLELYFGRVLGRTPRQQSDKGGFYPDLYERIRLEPNLDIPAGQSNAPLNQSEFVYHASKVAGYDLTDFFEKWGFLKIGTDVEMRYDYNRKFSYTLTRERVEDVKQRIKALDLPILPVAMEFITDANVEVFRRGQPIVRGTVTPRGIRRFLLRDWQNVVAFEFVKEDGEVLEYKEVQTDATDPNLMTVSLSVTDVDGRSILPVGYILNAIAYDGKRVEVGRSSR